MLILKVKQTEKLCKR